MRLVFLGTPLFAVPSLERLVEAGHEVLCVVTQPDRPKGRGQTLAASPVKQCAERLGLQVYQPERVRRPEPMARLTQMGADSMVVVGYGQIIPKALIDAPRYGIVNVHASLLPKYRGAAPIQWAIANGETVTGVTTMQIDEGLDTGAMLLKGETAIGPEETALDLGPRLAAMGADLLVETMAGLESGTIVPEAQDSALATYAPILKKEDGIIDWRLPARQIECRVRGLQPWPGCHTRFRGQSLHIWKSRPAEANDVAPGRIHRSGKRVYAGCGAGTMLELLEVQLEGKKRVSGTDFVNGQRIAEKEQLGDADVA